AGSRACRSGAGQPADAGVLESGRGGSLFEERQAFGVCNLALRIVEFTETRAAGRAIAGRQRLRIQAQVARRAVVDVAAGVAPEQAAGRIAVEQLAVPEAARVVLITVLQERIAGVEAQQQRALVGDRAVESLGAHFGVGAAR